LAQHSKKPSRFFKFKIYHRFLVFEFVIPMLVGTVRNLGLHTVKKKTFLTVHVPNIFILKSHWESFFK